MVFNLYKPSCGQNIIVMRDTFILIIFSLLTQGCGPQTEPVDTVEKGLPMHLFLLSGQSNMAGRGVIDEMGKSAHPGIFSLTKEGAWLPARDPLHFDKPIAGVGPGKAFAEALLDEEASIQIGLIPSAVGGSPISSWAPGAFYEVTASYPYDDAIRRARIAMQSGELKAILWHQGEADSKAALAPLYKAKLVELIGRFRSELALPALPFIIGQLGQFEGKPWNEWRIQVDKAHREVANEIPNVAFVSSAGLTHKGDSLHFSTAAARALGVKYADAYRKLMK